MQAEFVHARRRANGRPRGYAVIVDRISHDLPFYRSFLKNADALTGTQIINNPFWWSADDKFFNYALAAKAGRRRPQDRAPPPQGLSATDQRPLPPQPAVSRSTGTDIFDYVGFPAFLKPHDGGRLARRLPRPQSLMSSSHAYDQTRDLCMTLQAAVNFKEYFRCYVVGQSGCPHHAYDPAPPARAALRPRPARVSRQEAPRSA